MNPLLEDATPDFHHLLQRPVIQPISHLMAPCLTGKRVLVTGGGGSIGLELCRQILHCNPAELRVVDHSEASLYRAEQALDGPSKFLLGDVRDASWLAHQMVDVDTLYHAAAYKHVHLVERNPIAGIHNNVLGTAAVVDAARSAGVGALVLVSTDKAIQPAGLMGATKLWSEYAARQVAGAMRLAIVRFGNVFESSGSVVPLFRRQIRTGGPVTVTHPEMTRYFMTRTEAAQLVIQAGTLGNTGETFVLDMGEPIAILDLAKALIRNYTGREDGCEIVFTGVRPGEKIREATLNPAHLQATEHPHIHRMQVAMPAPDRLNRGLAALNQAVASHDVATAVKVMWQLLAEMNDRST